MQRFVIILFILLGLAAMVVAASTHRGIKAQSNLVTPVYDQQKWHLRNDTSVRGTVTRDQEGVRIEVSQADMNNSWKLEYFAITRPLKPHQKYKLSFDTKSSAPLAFEVSAYSAYTAYWQPHGGGHTIGLQNIVEAGPQWAHKEYTFSTADTDGRPDQAPTFTVGGMTGTLWLKDVTLTEAG